MKNKLCSLAVFAALFVFCNHASADTWATLPSISTNVFTKGAAITLTPGTCDNRTVTANYTADEIAALDPGTYTYRNVASTDGVDDLVYELDFLVLPADFTAAKTIICYGDSITAGGSWSELEDNNRYFDGRLNGLVVSKSYPRYLATMVPEGYNVIAQGKSQQWSDTILGWAGGVDVVTRNTLTLPASGSTVWAPTNLVFTASNPYGIDGGIQYVRDIQFPTSQTNYFAGLQMPDLPALETRPNPSGDSCTMTGWLGDKRVRVYGKDPHPQFTGDAKYPEYGPDQEWARISAGGSAVEIPAGTKFVPDTAYVYNDAIAVLFTGTNDEMGKEYWPEDDPKDHTTYIAMISDTVAKIPSGRYVAVSTMSFSQRSDEIEAAYSAAFGEHHLNMYKMMELYGLKVAVRLGLMTETQAAATTWKKSLMGDTVHPNVDGHKVVAYLLNQKLIDLEYIEGTRDNDIVCNIAVKPSYTELFTYDGTPKTFVAAGTGYTLTGTSSATEAGNYTVTLNLVDGYVWEDGTTGSIVVNWQIVKALSDPSWGYEVKGLGTAGNEVAVVFTNHTAAMTWTAPMALENVEFLVVGGGGGGGGCGKLSGDTQGGAGGGGGGVVTGTVFNIAQNATVTVNVGKGGSGGKDSSDSNKQGSGAAGLDMEDSSFSVDGVEYIVAKCGGSDQGAGNQGGIGGSNAGSRGKVTTKQVYELEAQAGSVGSTVSNLVNWVFRGYNGGVGVTNSGRPAGGGGGATSEGAKVERTTTNGTVYYAGDGGAGLLCDITGMSVVYGSGGGGGSTTYGTVTYNAGQGGDGAGDGSTDGDGGSALANRGGGGGGGGVDGAGGDGGSGIVVIRYTTGTVVEPEDPEDPEEPTYTEVAVPAAVENLVYNGAVQTGVAAGDGYTLTGDFAATAAGTYTATATLAESCVWADETTDPKTITWTIAKAQNSWTTTPSISPATWEVGDAGVYMAGTAASGTDVAVSITKNGAAFNGSLDALNSWEVGSYVITFTVAESENYTSLSKQVAVTVNVTGTALVVTTNAMSNASWGYIVSNLGESFNETAVVFTNHAATAAMTWTAPENLRNIEFLVVGGGGGGGGDSSADVGDGQGTAGCGGGGGGVITGRVFSVAANTSVSIVVGAGGAGGSASMKDNPTGGGAANKGGDTYVSVGGVEILRADGGGRDLGYPETDPVITTTAGYGGSNAGSRNEVPASDTNYPNRDSSYDKSYVSAVMLGKIGGVTYATTAAQCGAGGGGATTPGENGTLSNGKRYAGNGGEGLASDITGTSIVYGSGGGGGNTDYDGLNDDGSASNGGTGAGDGNTNMDALPNQGGGGGGGGDNMAGGNGGSGIVVLRYAIPLPGPVEVPSIPSKTYTGELLTADVDPAYEYSVVSNQGGTEVGEYEVELKLREGFYWTGEDASVTTTTLVFKITKAANSWTTVPHISMPSWNDGQTPGSMVAGVAKFGTVEATYTKDGVAKGAFTQMPTEIGEYVVTYTVPGTDNYTGLTRDVTFEILPEALPITGGSGGTDLGWGYIVSGLGEFRNETAVVFTNENATGISWTVPAAYNDVRFLVVGGGGGGGADTYASDPRHGGGGGGGGGVVTGLVNVAAGDIVSVKVGAGGAGGKCAIANPANSKYYGAADNNSANYSQFKISDTKFVKAFAGGWDQGVKDDDGLDIQENDAGEPGAAGGSSAGNRPLCKDSSGEAISSGEATKGEVGSEITKFEKFGNKGGSSTLMYTAAGGGGATAPGTSPFEWYCGGYGGEGLECDITGINVVYGSGGGGGACAVLTYGGKGGTGAGRGNYIRRDSNKSPIAFGWDAMPNQGGGGGGAGGLSDGGDGGSGIVVLRYTDPDGGKVVEDHVRAKILPQAYTGADQTCNLAETVGYTVTSVTGNNIGEYEVSVAPKLDDGYIWEDGTTAAKTFTWTIVEAENAWTTEPGISKETWVVNGDAGALIQNVDAMFGEVEVKFYKGETLTEFNGTLPTETGDYTIVYTVAGTDNYTGLEKRIVFEITSTELVAVDKPVVSYPSGTVFLAGSYFKPDVEPAESQGYTVVYNGDFTIVGESSIVIMLNEGYKWSDETIAPLEFLYTYVEDDFNDYYYGKNSTVWEDEWGLEYRSVNAEQWFLDAGRTTRIPEEITDLYFGHFSPDSLDARVHFTKSTQVDMIGLYEEVGKINVGEKVSVQGGSFTFRNEYSGAAEYIDIAPGAEYTIYEQKLYSTGNGPGYIDINAGSTFVAKRAVADQDIYIRFNTKNADGAVLAAQRCDTVSEFGWFEGGTPDSTVKIYIDRAQYGCIKFTNPDAVNGVAGPLAIDVGFNAAETADKTLIEIAGTLNVQPGSTLEVDATGLGEGIYTVLSSARLNDGADLVRYGTAKNVADGLYGTIIKSDDGNTINLVITGGPTVILVPGANNPTVAPVDVYDTARIAKPISYPCKPHLFVDESSNSQVIRWGSVNVTVPIYYDAALDANLISMVFNEHATPRIENVRNAANEITTDAIAIDDKGVLSIHFENTHDALYYALRTSTSIEGLKTAGTVRERLLAWDLYTPDGGSAYIKGEDLGEATNYQFTPAETDTIRLFTVQVVDEIPAAATE